VISPNIKDSREEILIGDGFWGIPEKNTGFTDFLCPGKEGLRSLWLQWEKREISWPEFWQAQELLAPASYWDIVLTDNVMPYKGNMATIGLEIALMSISRGCPIVAVVSRMANHMDETGNVPLLDGRHEFNVNGSKMFTFIDEEGGKIKKVDDNKDAKDWRKILEIVSR